MSCHAGLRRHPQERSEACGGHEEVDEQGREEGERKVILRLLGKRFGPLPPWATERISALSAADLEQVELRLLDASSLEELFL